MLCGIGSEVDQARISERYDGFRDGAGETSKYKSVFGVVKRNVVELTS